MQWLGTFGKANAAYAAKDNDRLVAPARRGPGARRPARRRPGLRVHLPVRRRPTAVGQQPGPGHRHPGAVARRLAPRATPPTPMPRAARWASSARRRPRASGSPRAAGAHYLQYSFAPRLRIVNGFVQSLNGLHDLAVSAQDAGARALFTAGETRAARGAARLRHRARGRATRSPRRGVVAELPRAAARLPALALQPPDDGRREGARPAPRGAVLRRRAALHRRPHDAARARASPTSARGPSRRCGCASASTRPRGSR